MLLQNVVIYRGESLVRRLLGMMPSVTRDPTTYILHSIGNETNSREPALENI